jgi:hypothetical protein
MRKRSAYPVGDKREFRRNGVRESGLETFSSRIEGVRLNVNRGGFRRLHGIKIKEVENRTLQTF